MAKKTTKKAVPNKDGSKSRKSSGGQLVIVESPAKARTINRYLGGGYSVEASMGHVRDLPNRNFGVDLENGFTPTYEVTTRAKKLITELKRKSAKAEKVYLATDLDREGEAIAWHLAEALNLPPEKVARVIFNEITESAIQEAFSQPRAIDVDKVNAQQARRILDRIVGYQISPLLWKKVTTGLSAGRVQSVAVRLIVEREDEIRAFRPEEFWRMSIVLTAQAGQTAELGGQWRAFLDSADDPAKGRTQRERAAWLSERDSFRAELVEFDGLKLDQMKLGDVERAAAALGFAIERTDRQTWEQYKDQGLELVEIVGRTDLANPPARWRVGGLETRRTTSRPPGPFTTATLQQAGANQLRFGASRTMRIAQSLYEGIEIGSEGNVGLITYMRTDSSNLSNLSVDEIRDLIDRDYGQKYMPERPNRYASGSRAQEAHEAIRPTQSARRPEDLRGHLSEDQWKLYDLIWKRTVACQMKPAEWDATSVEIVAETDSGKGTIKASGRILTFDGFMRVSGVTTSSSDQVLPQMTAGDDLGVLQIDPAQRFTQPPPRYTEASLVKALESAGIGRPSTYAPIIQTVQDRDYVEQLDRKFHPTALGEVVTRKLVEHFPKVMDVAFTAHMEAELDEVEESKMDWKSVLKEFYGPFSENLEKAKENMVHAKRETQPSEYTCEKCEAPMEYRFGKNGRFLSCSKYPDCKHAVPVDREGKPAAPELTEHECPNCKRKMMKRKGRFGPFLGCSGYPECQTIVGLDREGNPKPPKAPAKPTGLKCQKCGNELVIRDSKRGPFLSCGKFPRCRNTISIQKLDELKELQEKGVWPPKTVEEADSILGRNKTGAKKKAPSRKKTASKGKKKKKKTAKAVESGSS
jgi:DNA topoisomerase-1